MVGIDGDEVSESRVVPWQMAATSRPRPCSTSRKSTLPRRHRCAPCGIVIYTPLVIVCTNIMINTNG
jgi:hypothetical protein